MPRGRNHDTNLSIDLTLLSPLPNLQVLPRSPLPLQLSPSTLPLTPTTPPPPTVRTWEMKDSFRVPIAPDTAFKNHIIEEFGGCGCSCYEAINAVGVFDYIDTTVIKNISSHNFIEHTIELGNYDCWCQYYERDCIYCLEQCT